MTYLSLDTDRASANMKRALDRLRPVIIREAGGHRIRHKDVNVKIPGAIAISARR